MRRSPWAACLWPGLPQLWRGDGSGLLVAFGFALLLDVLLLASLVWTDLVGPHVRTGAWIVVGCAWIVSAAATWKASRRVLDENFSADGDLFPDAISEYLQGNWVPAERLLNTLVRKNPRDVDARLMLATLWRHTGRFDEAREALASLRRLEEAQKWQLEIRRESQLLDEELNAPAQELVPTEPQVATLSLPAGPLPDVAAKAA
jgi:hypothetical protein